MKKIIIAFDVDWTLRDNTKSETCMFPNHRIVELLKILSSFKNVKIVVWSGQGKEWADTCVSCFDLKDYVWKTASKNYKGLVDWKHTFEPDFIPDIAIDDTQSCELGLLNLIVKEK